MKRARILATATALFLFAAASLWVWHASPTVDGRTFEQEFPGVLERAGVRVLELHTEAEGQVALPLALRIRQFLTPRSGPGMGAIGFSECVQHFTLESKQNHCRMDCLVRYSEAKVARVVLRYPPAAKVEAGKLRDGFRELSGGLLVS
jgi:hypothetical protein